MYTSHDPSLSDDTDDKQTNQYNGPEWNAKLLKVKCKTSTPSKSCKPGHAKVINYILDTGADMTHLKKYHCLNFGLKQEGTLL